MTTQTGELSIGEAAQRCGLSIDTLRYYERENLLRAERTQSGHRRYSEDDLGWIGVLACLRETGMPIARMREFAGLVHEDDDGSVPVRLALLEQHRSDVRAHVRELEANLEHLQAKIAWYAARVPAPDSALGGPTSPEDSGSRVPG